MKDSAVKVSIIVPVYNNEEYLREALQSIANQSFEDFEVIVVNDGSTDNSPAIIDQFVSVDHRFSKIDQPNSGISVARNTGLYRARGLFVTFADGDDVLPKEALQSMDNVARNNKCDLIIGGVKRIDGSIEKVNERTKKLSTKRRIKTDDIDMVHGLSVWNKWFLRSIIVENKVEFEKFCHLEDGVFLYRFLQYARDIVVCEDFVYRYYKRIPLHSESVTQQVRPGLLNDAIAAYERICELTKNYSDEFHQELTYRIVGTTLVGDYYRKIWKLNESDERLLVETIQLLWNKMKDLHKQRIINTNTDLHFDSGIKSRKQLLYFPADVTIYVTSRVSRNGLGILLNSLYGQKLTNFRLILHKCHVAHLPEEFRGMKNLEINSHIKLEKNCLNRLTDNTDGNLLIVDHDGYYDYDTLYSVNEILNRTACDFVSFPIQNSSEEEWFANKLFKASKIKEKDFHFSGNLKKDVNEFAARFSSVFPDTYNMFFLGAEETERASKSICIKAYVKKYLKRWLNKLGFERNKKEVSNNKRVLDTEKTKFILDYYFSAPVESKSILLEGIGKHVKGNILYIIRELHKPEYEGFKIYVAVKEENKASVSQFLSLQGINNVCLVEVGSKKYRKCLETAEYLVNEVCFPNYWIKKREQKYINIWHGTPLKKLAAGREGGVIHDGGVAQKNFISADYILFPNYYTRNHLLEDHFVDKVALGKALWLGYPRTGALLAEDALNKGVRNSLAKSDEYIVTYMPTYRDKKRTEEQLNKIRELFETLEAELPKEYLVYVNLHHKTNAHIDYSQYSRIREFPSEYDTYQVLAVADCLCTDYSSLMFDFATTRKNIVLYCYDLDEYKNDTGLYMNPEELPFHKALTAKEVVSAIQTEKNYDDSKFVEEFCKYDSALNTTLFCRSMFLNDFDSVNTEEICHGKENITILYSDGWHNCSATNLVYKLGEVLTNKENIYLSYKDTFVEASLNSAYPLLNHFKSIGTKGRQLFTYNQKKIKKEYLDGKIGFSEAIPELESAYKTEYYRCFDGLMLNKLFVYDSVDTDKIIAFSYFDCEKYLFLHEDQIRLIKEGNQYMIDAIECFISNNGVLLMGSEADADLVKEQFSTAALIIQNELALKLLIEKSVH